MGGTLSGANGGAYRWYLAAVLALAHLVSFIDRHVLSVLLEPLKAQHGLSDATLGLLQGTSFVALYSLATIPLGIVADRVSRRGLIAGGLIVWSLATAACGLAQSLPGLFAARVMVGLGEAALVPAAMSLLAVAFAPAQLGRAVSMFTAGASLGKSAAFAGGGALLALFTAWGGLGPLAPWQGVFVVMAVPGLILALAMLSVREPVRPPAGPGVLREAVSFVLSSRAWLLHMGAATCVLLLVQSLGAWTPSFYVRGFGLTPAQAGIATGTALLVAAPLGHLAGGMLTDWFQQRGKAPAVPVMLIGFAGSSLTLAAWVAAGSLSASILLYGLVTFCMTLGAPAALAGMQMLVPDRLRGSVTAIFLAATTMIGIGAGPALVGLVSDNVGALWTALVLVLPVFAAIGALLALASARATR